MKKFIIAGLLLGVASLFGADAPAAASTATSATVPLKVPLPKPRLLGTQVAVNLPNLDTSDGPRDVQVPAGTTNVALNKPVTSSDPAPIIGMLEMATDGEIDGEDGFYVELDVNQQWLQIDLQQPVTVYAIAVWHFYSQARAYKSVVIQLSDDPEFKKGVTTVYNSDATNTLGLGAGKDKPYIDTHKGRIFPVNAVKARYVRLYSAGNTANDSNHYIEVQVYGVPAK